MKSRSEPTANQSITKSRALKAQLALSRGVSRGSGGELLTFYRLPQSQWRSLRTTNAIERMQPEFRWRVKTQAAPPNQGAVLRVFFGL